MEGDDRPPHRPPHRPGPPGGCTVPAMGPFPGVNWRFPALANGHFSAVERPEGSNHTEMAADLVGALVGAFVGISAQH